MYVVRTRRLFASRYLYVTHDDTRSDPWSVSGNLDAAKKWVYGNVASGDLDRNPRMREHLEVVPYEEAVVGDVLDPTLKS